MIYRALTAAALLMLAACATPIAETPAQRAYALQSDYAALLELAAGYAALPDCVAGAAAAAPCAEPAVVARLQAADRVAWAALSEARALVLAPAEAPDSAPGPPAAAADLDVALAAAGAALAGLRQAVLEVGR